MYIYTYIHIYIYIYIYTYIYVYIYIYMYHRPSRSTCHVGARHDVYVLHTRHTLPPFEIDLGLFWADFTDLEGKHLFHRIG